MAILYEMEYNHRPQVQHARALQQVLIDQIYFLEAEIRSQFLETCVRELTIGERENA